VITLFAAFSLSGCGGSSNPVSVAVTATATTVDGKDTVTLTATVTNDSNADGVTWAASGGTLSDNTTTSVTFTAPAATTSAQTVTITATSVADTSKTATITLTVPALLANSTTTQQLTGQVGSAYSVQLTVSGGISPYTWKLDPASGPLPAGWTISTSGVLSGPIPTSGQAAAYNFTVDVTDSGSPTALSTTLSLTLTINPAPTITFPASATLAAGTYNVVYTGASVAATGGAGALTYSLASGSLPFGLSLNPGTGAIAGTPTTAASVGTFPFTVKAIDGYGDSATSPQYTIVVSYPQLTISTATTLPEGYGGTAYSQTLAASGGSGAGYGWTVTSGASSLSAVGLGVSSAGVVSGTTPIAGSASFTVKVTDSANNTASQTFSVTIGAGLTITTATTLPEGYAGTAYSTTLATSGGTSQGLTWTVTAGASSLTAVGLSVSSAGVVSGATPIAGSASFTVKVTDSGGNTASQAFSVTIGAGLTITTAATLPSGYAGTAYSTTLATSGGTGQGLTWTVTSGASSLTAVGLSVSGSGVVSGTTPIAGSATFTVKVTDSANNTASQTFSVTIGTGLTITTAATLPEGYVGTAYSVTLQTEGGTGQGLTWTVTSGASSLTAVGLSVSSAGVVSGATPIAGSASFAVKVADSGGNTTSQTFSVTIGAQLTITTAATLPEGYVGTAYSTALVTSGGSGQGLNWTVTSGASSLSAVGLSVSSAGVVSGSAPIAGSASFTVKVTDSANNTASQTFSVTIGAGLIITTTATLPTGYVGTAYSTNLATSGGTGQGLTWTVTSGASSLSAVGLSVSGSGVVSGTTPVAGSASFTVKVTDSAGNTTSRTFSVTINAALTITTSATLPEGYVGTAYSQALTTSGGSGQGLTWTVTSGASSLSAVGLSVSGAGVVSGATPIAGSASFAVKVTDSANNSASQTFSVTVGAQLTITTAATLPEGYVGTAYSTALATSGGSGQSLTWTVTSGASSLSAVGLGVSGAGVVSGATPIAGSASFTVKVTDSANNTASQTFSVTIGAGLIITTAATLPTGYVGTAYSTSLATSGGTGQGLTWTVTSGASSLTAVGLSVSGAGVVSGTTPVAGSASFTVKVTDSANNTASQTFSVTINAALAITSPTTLPAGYVGTAYSQALTTSGGSGQGLTWTVTSGASSLSAVGLSVSSAGVVSGSSPIGGSASFAVKVTDSANNTASQTFSVTIGTGLTITSANPLPVGYAGTAYSDTLTTAGGSGQGLTWTVTSGASSLSAVGLSVSSGGVVSGSSPIAGTASFTVKVTDSASNSNTASFNVTINAGLTITTAATLPVGYAGVSYSETLATSGGTGQGLTWTVTSGASSLSAVGLSVSGSGVVSGTTPVAGSASFTVKVTDSANNTTSQTFSVTINGALTITSPTTLPAGNAGVSYSDTLTTSGGSGQGLSWTVTSGASSLSAVGLGVSSAGVVSGTTPIAGSASFAVKVTDSANNTASQTFSVTINAGSQVSGQINLINFCGNGSSFTLPTFTVSINATGVQPVTTDPNGNYSFASVPNGTYTITPSMTGSNLPEYEFYPGTLANVVVDNNSVSGENFGVSLGYTVSGTLSYTGSTTTGPFYVELNNNNCGGGGASNGTTITAPGAFTIRGVEPGSYTLNSWRDIQGFGQQNASDPTGSVSNLTISNASLTGESVTLADPSAVTLSTAPTLGEIDGFTDGVLINFTAPTNSNGVETPTSYTVQWNNTNSFTSPAGSHSFAASGANGSNVWILNSANVTGLTPGDSYYFRVQGVAGTSTSAWSSTVGPITLAEQTAANTITGQVTFTGTAKGPLYVGFYDQNTGQAWATQVGSKTTPPTSPASYNVEVPNGTYGLFAIIDQNNDGLIDAGDITNTNTGNGPPSVTISGNATENVTLPSTNSTVAVTTQYSQSTSGGNTSSNYNISLEVRGGIKEPIAVTLTSGPNLINPVDMGACGSNCGNPEFQYSASIGGNVPKAGDSYTFTVAYSDGTTDTTVTGAVTGVLTSSALPTLSSPTGSGIGFTPNFDWTYPANASSYVYQFSLCCGTHGTIWRIPSNNSNSNGFTSTQVVPPLVWGVDPTNPSNTPSPASLSAGTYYGWSVQSQDSNGNLAQAQMNFETQTGPVSLPAASSNPLPSGVVGVAYSGAINASGGAGGGNYYFVVNGTTIPTNNSYAKPPNTDGLTFANSGGNTLSVAGTPSTAESVSLTIEVIDTTNPSGDNATITYTVVVSSSAPLTLTAAGTLGNAVVALPFGSGVVASGGSGSGYVFSVNGTAISTSGTPLSLANGLSASSTGGSILTISGTPTTTANVSFNVSVVDGASNTAGPNSYTVYVTSGPNGNNNSYLSGTYVCELNGHLDKDGTLWASLFSFQANGSAGTFTSGIFDSNGNNTTDYPTEVTGTVTGTYSVGSDNNGLASFTTTPSVIGSTTSQWAIALTNFSGPTAAEFRMVEIDDVGATPSGHVGTAECYQATTSAFASSTISGNGFAFELNGESQAGGVRITVGRFTTSSSAETVTTGDIDQAKGIPVVLTNTTFTGTYTLPTSPSFTTTGRYTAAFTASSGTENLAIYIIDSARMFMLETDSEKGVAVGHVRTQQQTSYSAANIDAPLVFYAQGLTYNGSSLTGYYAWAAQGSGDGAGNMTINESYNDDSGAYVSGTENGTLPLTFDSSNPGRVTMNPGGGTDMVYMYLYNNNAAFEMNVNTKSSGTSNVDAGYMDAQTQTAFTNDSVAGNYMLGQFPPLSSTGIASVGEIDNETNGNYTLDGTTAGEGLFDWDQSETGLTYTWLSTTYGVASALANGSPESTCIDISSTKYVCISNTTVVPAVLILQQ
jgi:hypothetical protein